MVEQLPFKETVVGSTPTGRTGYLTNDQLVPARTYRSVRAGSSSLPARIRRRRVKETVVGSIPTGRTEDSIILLPFSAIGGPANSEGWKETVGRATGRTYKIFIMAHGGHESGPKEKKIDGVEWLKLFFGSGFGKSMFAKSLINVPLQMGAWHARKLEAQLKEIKREIDESGPSQHLKRKKANIEKELEGIRGNSQEVIKGRNKVAEETVSKIDSNLPSIEASVAELRAKLDKGTDSETIELRTDLNTVNAKIAEAEAALSKHANDALKTKLQKLRDCRDKLHVEIRKINPCLKDLQNLEDRVAQLQKVREIFASLIVAEAVPAPAPMPPAPPAETAPLPPVSSS